MIINSRIWPFDSIDLSFEWLSLLLLHWLCCRFLVLFIKREGKLMWQLEKFYFRTTHEIQANFISEEQKQRSFWRRYKISPNMMCFVCVVSKEKFNFEIFYKCFISNWTISRHFLWLLQLIIQLKFFCTNYK